MKRIVILLLLISLIPGISFAGQYHRDVTPTRNVIFMIADGTSMGVLSAARWYQIYNGLGGDKLFVDPYLCGAVKTHSSNSPIPDSAPAMSGYMTGQPQRVGNISIYPKADPAQDIIKVDADRAYQPLTTLMEAAKYEQNKATGLVVTVTFDHATPAACASHAANRNERDYIIPQMAGLGIDVVFGGGSDKITDDIKQCLNEEGAVYIEHDIDAFRQFEGNDKVWALFAPKYMAYELDRDPMREPSLAEMTRKAIDLLSKNPNGFFLMVEGSQIDMAAHANDPAGTITEFLAFDRAVNEVIEFAKKDGNTTVVICSDHGTAGLSFGNRHYENYTSKGLDSVFMNVSAYRKTAKGLEAILLNTKPAEIKSEFKKYTEIEITDKEAKTLMNSKNYKEEDYMKVSNSQNMISTIANIMTSRTHFAFLSGSHTGEDVFLAAYHPNGDLPLGLNTNTELNSYLFDALGLKKTLDEHSSELFVRHDEVFGGMNYKVILGSKSKQPVLRVEKGADKLEISANGRTAHLNGKQIRLPSVAVYISANGMFYLPRNISKLL